MGVFDFVKEAGAKIGIGDSKDEKAAKAAAEQAAKADKKAASAAQAKAVAESVKARRKASATNARKEEMMADKAKATGLETYVQNMGLEVKNLDIRFHNGIASIKGEAANQDIREKVILAVGNTQDVGQVHDQITLPAGADAESVMHVVESGDTLWAIAEEHYSDGSKYPAIFEANKPMLTDPDKIYVGQVLRVPNKA